MVVQDARRTPTSGKIVVSLGNYDPHAKTLSIDTEKASFYLTNGAQPSPRVASLLASEGIALPSWVKTKTTKNRSIRNTEKLRRNRPAEEVVADAPAEEPSTEVVEEAVAEPVAAETPAEEKTEE